jgi:hypothetical protein
MNGSAGRGSQIVSENFFTRSTLPKGEVFLVRVAAASAAKIHQAIKKSGMAKPEWARSALVSAASG